MAQARRMAALVTAFAVVTPAIAQADTWIVEPTPESTDAVTRGSADLAAAQKLAKAKQVAEAVALFETVARTYPASAHDCNLALAYLRAGDLTRAQLMSDVAELRGGARPDWCTSSLPSQLVQALRDQGYVPLTVTTTPADAVISVAGLTVRGVHLFWLPVATYKVAAHREGYDDALAPIAVAAPSAELTITMRTTPVAADPIDTVDGSGDLEEVDLAEPERPAKLPEASPSPSWPGWAGVIGGGAFVALGAGFHVAALGTKDDADATFNDSAMFDSLSSTFSRERALAVTGYVVGAAAVSFGIWWLVKKAGEHR